MQTKSTHNQVLQPGKITVALRNGVGLKQPGKQIWYVGLSLQLFTDADIAEGRYE